MKFKRGDFCMCVSGMHPEMLGRSFALSHVYQYPGVGPTWETDPPQFIHGDELPAVFREQTLMLIKGQGAPAETLIRQPVPADEHEFNYG